jgi:hypothetical protein
MADDMRLNRISAALDGINDRLIDGDAAKSRLSALAQSLGVDAYGLTDRIAALNAKAGDMDGIAALVGGIRTIDEVPEQLRDEVAKMLEE